jgi:hypothetical protein
VQAYIAAMPGWKRDVARRLDALIERSVRGVRKAVKWNSPFYGLEGKGWFLGIHTFTHYVKVAFFRGAALRPPPPGASKSGDTRYLDLREDDKLDDAQLAKWFKQAAALSGWDPSTKRPKQAKAGAARKNAVGWKCPTCSRSFTQVNQRHACGTGERSQVLRNRPESVVRTYAAVEAFAKALGPIEIVARERYVLFRSVRIFADLVIMSDAVRIAIHLSRRVDHPLFIKVVQDRKKVTHVAKLSSEKDFRPLQRYLKEAYQASLG